MDAFEHVLASLQRASLDPAHWPAASALVDKLVGIEGNALLVTKGVEENVRILFAAAHYRGQRRPDLEHDYLQNYHPWDERIPRVRRLPYGRLVHITDLYTERELKTSRSYNEFSVRSSGQNSLNVRLDGPAGSHISWIILDPVKAGAWQSAQTKTVQRLLPHVRHVVHARQALSNAQAVGVPVGELLGNTGMGVIQLDRRGRIIEANDLARAILERCDGLYDQGGSLGAWLPSDDTHLQQLLAAAVRHGGSMPVGGSMALRRTSSLVRLMLHVIPVNGPDLDFGMPAVAALLLVADPNHRHQVDPWLAQAALGLTASESEVAVMLAEGNTPKEIALLTGRAQNTVYRHLKQIYNKTGVSRQPELVQLVLPLAGLSRSPR